MNQKFEESWDSPFVSPASNSDSTPPVLCSNRAGVASVPMVPRSADMIRIIRRSVRCWWFGLVGLIPIVGIGFAAHAVRLHRQVVWELNEPWSGVALRSYWLFGAACLIGYDFVVGWEGSLFVFIAFTALQAYRIWQSFPRRPGPIWNPARHYLRWGTALGYLGFFNSIAAVVMAAWFLVMHPWY